MAGKAMTEGLRAWWTLDTSAEQQSADNPFSALGVRLGHAGAVAESAAG
jgi:hypothetical protein